MRADGAARLRGLLSAVALAIGAALLAWLCVRAATVRALPVSSAWRAQIAARHADTVLDGAMLDLVRGRGGMLPPETIAAVRRAAQAAPLDARPFLILGHQQKLDNQPALAVKTLEAAQRLDPRSRLTHLLLLDSYLKAGHYADVAEQFAVATRLVGQARDPIAAALAQMIKTPEMHEAARAALRADPTIERMVLTTLAKSDMPPATIFALASATARRDAGLVGNWGPALVARMVAEGRYAAARSVWQNVYRLSAAQVSASVFDGGFRELPGSPPFNWTLTAGSLGAADIDGGALAITYYGRDTGDLAGQMLVLPPGAYQFAVTVDGSKTATGPSLVWTLRCVTDSKADLMTVPTAGTATGEPHRIGARFIVPPSCPAQQLTLAGNAGEFPSPINLTLRNLDIRGATAAAQ